MKVKEDVEEFLKEMAEGREAPQETINFSKKNIN